MATRVLHVFTVPDSLIFLRGQVPFLRERGVDISVVTSPGAGLTRFGEQYGVPVYPVPMARRITPGADLASLRALVGILREVRPHIVHAHTPKGGLLGTSAARVAGAHARIYHMRGLPLVTARGVPRALLRVAEQTSCALATQVLCVSASLRDEAVRRGLVAPSRVRVLGEGSGNGVDAEVRFDPARLVREAVLALRERLGIPGTARVVGFVGRFVRDKGIVELADAWKRLRARHADLHLVLAGVFEERDPIPPAVRDELERDERVHFPGFVEDTAVLYACLDVVAFPSHREGFPNVPLEAAAMELPIVGARSLGTVDAIVDGVTGTLVPTGDARALEDALARYLEDRELARRHGRAARERALRSFRPERVWSELAALYAQLSGN